VSSPPEPASAPYCLDNRITEESEGVIIESFKGVVVLIPFHIHGVLIKRLPHKILL
jgi:hypothetical protein